MTPPERLYPERPNQAYNRLRTLYQCALALLIYEKKEWELIEKKVSQLKLLTSSGDNKSLSPEEKPGKRRSPPRIPPTNIPKL